MKTNSRFSDSLGELVDEINIGWGEVSVVEPDGTNYGYYLEFFLPSTPGQFFVFFGDQVVLSSSSRDEILCFLWGMQSAKKIAESMAKMNL